MAVREGLLVVALLALRAIVASSDVVSLRSARTLPLLAGISQSGLGLARLGTLVKFISHIVAISLTAGAAVLIATSQMKHALTEN